MDSAPSSPGFWDGFEHDPREAGNAHLRASDHDRDLVLALLGNAYAEGRLTRAEFDERSSDVAAAKTIGELPSIVDDLIARASAVPSRTDLRAEAERRYHADRREALTYLGPAIICWVIWAWLILARHGTVFPWPVFVTIGTAMPALRMWLNPEDHIASRQRKLEKKVAAGEPAALDAPDSPEHHRPDYRGDFRPDFGDRHRDRRRRR